MPARVATGKSRPNPSSGTHVFEGRDLSEAQSIGFTFDSLKTTAWLFADRFGEKPLGYTQMAAGAEPDETLKALQPLFAFVHTPCFALIPEILFDEHQADSLLSFTTTFEKGQGEVSIARIPEHSMYMLYFDALDAQGYADEHFPGLKVQHAMVHYYRVGVQLSENLADFVLLMAAGTMYHVLYFKNRQLQLANILESAYTDDLLYYLLFTAKELGIGEHVPIHLTGVDKEFQPKLSKFAKNVVQGIDFALLNMKNMDGTASPAILDDALFAYTATLCV